MYTAFSLFRFLLANPLCVCTSALLLKGVPSILLECGRVRPRLPNPGLPGAAHPLIAKLSKTLHVPDQVKDRFGTKTIYTRKNLAICKATITGGGPLALVHGELHVCRIRMVC